MRELEVYKLGVIDCLVMFAKARPSTKTISDFKIGINSLEKPSSFIEECNWLENVVVNYVDTGSIELNKLLIPDTLIIKSFQVESEILVDPTDVVEFISSVKSEFDEYEEYYDFVEYCDSIVRQFKYIGNKKITPRILDHTYGVLDSCLDIYEHNRYIEEKEWIRDLLYQYLERGSVKIIRNDIPQAIGSCSFINSYLSCSLDVINFIESIELLNE